MSYKLGCVDERGEKTRKSSHIGESAIPNSERANFLRNVLGGYINWKRRWRADWSLTVAGPTRKRG